MYTLAKQDTQMYTDTPHAIHIVTIIKQILYWEMSLIVRIYTVNWFFFEDTTNKVRNTMEIKWDNVVGFYFPVCKIWIRFFQ